MYRLGKAARWLRSDGNGLWALMATVAAGALLAPVAVATTGSTIREGLRNPTSGSAARETQIIASTATNTYGTRQSNLGKGGGAIYGCRSALDTSAPQNPAKSTPCVRVNNLSNGLAFQFAFKGPLGGVIQSGGGFAPDAKARPFITNATGVALGLNADRVDGLNASEIIAAARAGLGGTGSAGPKGDPGDKGDKGDKGDPGDGASFSTEKWGVIGRNTLGSPSADYRVGPFGRTAPDDYSAEEPPPLGDGSLGMSVAGVPSGGTTTDAEKLAFGNETDFADTPVEDLTDLSYSMFAGVDSLTGVSQPGLGIEVDQDSTTAGADYTQLVYLPDASSVPSAPASPVPGIWQEYDAAASGSAWMATGSGGTATGCTSAAPCTFDELKTALGSDAVISYSLGFTKGRDNAFVGAVDALQVNDEVFDFEPGGVIKATATP